MPSAVLEKPQANKTTEQKQVYRPALALYEDGESYIALIEMPGVDEKAVQLRLANGQLTIEAPLKLELPAGTTQKYSEMRLGDYRRVLELGDQVNEDNIEATFKAGFLKVILPKSKKAKTRKITIKAN